MTMNKPTKPDMATQPTPAPAPGSVSQATLNIIEECMNKLNEACTSNGETVKLTPYFQRAIDSENAMLRETTERELALLEAKLAAAQAVNVALRTALVPFALTDDASIKGIPNEQVFLWKPSRTNRDMPGISVAHINAAKSALTDTASLEGLVAVPRTEWERLKFQVRMANALSDPDAVSVYEQNEALRELVKKHAEYEAFLKQVEASRGGYVVSRPYMAHTPEDIAKGAAFRAKIETLKRKAGLT